MARLAVRGPRRAADELRVARTPVAPRTSAPVFRERLAHDESLTEREALDVLECVLEATAAELGGIEINQDPTEALYTAALRMLDAIVAGHGVTSLEIFLAMIEAITASDTARAQASTLRKRRLAHGLAARLQLKPGDKEVRRAVSLWSAMMAGYYAGIRHSRDEYLPRHDARLHERACERMAENYHDIMGFAAPVISRSATSVPRG